MAFNVIGKSMPIGLPGQVMKQSYNVIETHAQDPDTPVTAYGVPVKLVGGKATAYTSGTIDGFSVRPDAVQLGGANPAFGDSGVPDPAQPLDVMVSGYIAVKVKAGISPVVGDGVCIFTSVGSNGEPIGTISNAQDSGHTYALKNSIFETGVDDNNVAVIRIGMVYSM